jgi:hypothetical protein
MQQKENDRSTLAEQSLEHGKKGLTFEDKYVILQVKNQKLKRQDPYPRGGFQLLERAGPSLSGYMRSL